jgi:hypothetical protein
VIEADHAVLMPAWQGADWWFLERPSRPTRPAAFGRRWKRWRRRRTPPTLRFKRVYDHYTAFRENYASWREVAYLKE